MLGPQEDELVIVSDGALCFTPWVAVINAVGIRTVTEGDGRERQRRRP